MGKEPSVRLKIWNLVEN